MRQIEVSAYGEPEVLHEAQRPDPVPAGGTVLVRVEARTVNPVDLWTRQGLFAERLPDVRPPFVLGWDLAGTVVEAAEGYAAGDRVVGDVPWFEVAARGIGTYAELIAADPEWLAPLPSTVDPAAGATLGMNAPTAAQALELLGGDVGTLLVTGASGAVGGFAVQLAAASGIDVVALAAGADDEDHLAALGAKVVLPRLDPAGLAAAVRERVAGGVDAVLDAALLGAPALAAVRDGGTFVGVNLPSAPPAERDVEVTAVYVRPRSAQLRDLAEQVAAGRLTTRVAATLPLADAAEAHRRTAAGGLRGKIVLV